jgi:hypothetical protein
MSDRANWVLRWVHEEDLDFNEGDHDWEEPTVAELVEALSDKLDLGLTEFTVDALAWALEGG